MGVFEKSSLQSGDSGGNDLSCRSDPWRWLRRQVEIELAGQDLLVGVELGVAAQDQRSTVCGREVNVEHLDRGELVEHNPRREAGGKRLEPGSQGDVQAIGEKRDEDMRFDALFQPMVDRTQLEIILQRFEGALDFGQLNIKLPQLCGVTSTEIGPQQIAALPSANLPQLVVVERVAEYGAAGRDIDRDQTPSRGRLGAGGAELHQQFLTRELHRRKLREPCP